MISYILILNVSKDIFFSYKIKKIRHFLFTLLKYIQKAISKLRKLNWSMNELFSDILKIFSHVNEQFGDLDFSCPTHAMMMLHTKPVRPSLSCVAWNVNGAAAVAPRARIEFAPWSARLGRYRSVGVCTILTISGRITFGRNAALRSKVDAS